MVTQLQNYQNLRHEDIFHFFQKFWTGGSKPIFAEIQRKLQSTENIWARMARTLSNHGISKKDILKKDTSNEDTSNKQDTIKAEMIEWRSRLFECWNFFKILLSSPANLESDSDLKSDGDLESDTLNYHLKNLLRFCSARHLTAETIIKMSRTKKTIEIFQFSRFDPKGFYSEYCPILTNNMGNLVENLTSTMDVAILNLQKGHLDKSRQSFKSTAEILRKTIKFAELEDGPKEKLVEMVDILKYLDNGWKSLAAVLKLHPNKGFFNFKNNKDILSSVLMPEYFMGWSAIRHTAVEKPIAYTDSVAFFLQLRSMIIHILLVANFAASFEKVEKEKAVYKGCNFESFYKSKCARPQGWDSPLANKYLELVCQIAFAAMKEQMSKSYIERKIAEHYIQNREKYSTLKSQKKVCFGVAVSPQTFKQLNEEVEHVDDGVKWMSSFPENN